MRFVLTGTLTIVILGILTLGTNHSMAQTANVTPGFIANPSNTNNTNLRTTDPNYNTYQNLGLGFSINYLKNMTVSEKTNNSLGAVNHSILFSSPSVRMIVLVTQATGAFGLPTTLDEITREGLLHIINNSTTITGKTKGSLNGLPAYKIDAVANPTTSLADYYSGLAITKIPIHEIFFFTVKGALFYDIGFGSSDIIQSNFIPMVNKIIGSFKYN